MKVWDLPLRIFYWLLVIAFSVAFITEDEFLSIHIRAGYLVTGLLIFRFIWGFYGGKYARFTSFLCGPDKAIIYFNDALALKAMWYIGHNPAGELIILLLFISLMVTTTAGFAVYGAKENAGPLAIMSMENEHLWEEVHEFFANTTLMLIFIHIVGIIFESYLHKENLSKAMLTGYKRKPDHNKTGE